MALLMFTRQVYGSASSPVGDSANGMADNPGDELRRQTGFRIGATVARAQQRQPQVRRLQPCPGRRLPKNKRASLCAFTPRE